jgi:hypothetical protein
MSFCAMYVYARHFLGWCVNILLPCGGTLMSCAWTRPKSMCTNPCIVFRVLLIKVVSIDVLMAGCACVKHSAIKRVHVIRDM